jgi:hypothetical protein
MHRHEVRVDTGRAAQIFFAGAGCQLRARPGELSDPLRLAEQIALGKGAGAVVVGQLDDPADD